ncbi:hypothetical protein [Desulfobotulus sp.]|jgi:hypothetical protein|uniref:hypothetical protein n=1 Tax=Desulfobotulus sp. TaxID=1940337 RepID=UPI002A3616CA|nr:hypothetical protein [Desulfobotulus sp.]MDY0161958.1 hypothetical protein [Desulfobotulus sp.]
MADIKSSEMLSSEEKMQLHEIAGEVDRNLGEAFEKAFMSWKAKWFTGEAAFSSHTEDNKKLPEYQALREMGAAIIPLVVGKMIEKDQFVALVLYEELIEKAALRIRYAGSKDPFFMEGEAARAIRTARLWLEAQTL